MVPGLSPDTPQEPATDALSPGSPQKVKPVVVEVEGPRDSVQLAWRGGTWLIGTGTSNDVQLHDTTVSRKHAVATLLGGLVEVRDLGSRNGTRYLGARIQQAEVPVGASITVGKTTLRFVPPDAPGPRKEPLLVGASAAMVALRGQVARLARLSLNVLVRGETGAGKGQVARALHALGPSATGPLVVFDCASVQRNLLESELFGHVRGAFTGAEVDRAGAAEQAEGGTLFLDEVAELPSALQATLLRLVESREFRRVGATEARRGNFRLIAATHIDLREAVEQKHFRSDLYHRLSVAEVLVPPLRERVEDIPALIEHFLSMFTPRPPPLDPETLARLQGAAWPGNVRELRNAVERMVALEEPTAGPRAPSSIGLAARREQVLAHFEREFLQAVIEKNGGNVSAAAREAQVSRAHFYRLLERHGLTGSAQGK